jgi:hypothetical protein
VSRTSAATIPPSDNLTISPGTSSAAGTVRHAPSRRTDAFSASRDFKAARVAWARLSWNSPSAALNTKRPAMITASTYSPSASWSAIAASSIHGTGAQNFSSAMRSGCSTVSGIVFGPNLSRRRRASSLLRPSGQSSVAVAADLASEVFPMGCGAVVTMIYPNLARSRDCSPSSGRRDAGKPAPQNTTPCASPRTLAEKGGSAKAMSSGSCAGAKGSCAAAEFAVRFRAARPCRRGHVKEGR